MNFQTRSWERGLTELKKMDFKKMDFKKMLWIRYLLPAIVIGLVVIFSYMAEAYVFNSHTKDGNGYEHNFTEEELIHNGTFTEEGEIVFEGREGYLIIPNGGRRLYSLVLEYSRKSKLEIYVYDVPLEKIAEDNFINSILLDPRAEYASRVIDSTADELILYFKTEGDAVSFQRIATKNSDYFHWQRFIFLICFGCSGLFLFFAKDAVSNKPEVIFSVICVFMGLAMLVSVPYNKNCWDDETHFKNAYKLSYALTGRDAEWNKAAGDFIGLNNAWAMSYEERLLLEAQMDMDGEVRTGSEESGNIFGYLNKITLLPMAIGLLIGRGLHLSFSNMFVFARIFNIILYAAVMYYAIKITPIGKRLMSFIALLPTLMYLLASYSGDYFINAFAMLGVAVLLHEMYTPDKVMSKKNAILFIVSMFLAFLMKQIYIPLILAAFFLPKEKFASKRSRQIFLGISCLCCILIFIPVILTAGGLSDPRGGDTSVTRQIQYIVSNPLGFSRMFVMFIARRMIPLLFGLELSINFNLYGIKGGVLTLLMPMVFTFLILTDRNKDGLGAVSGKRKAGILSLIALVTCFIFGSMYLGFTPVGAGEIAGVQPRYVVPFMFLLFMMLPDLGIRHKISDRLYNISVYGFILFAIGLCNYSFFVMK